MSKKVSCLKRNSRYCFVIDELENTDTKLSRALTHKCLCSKRKKSLGFNAICDLNLNIGLRRAHLKWLPLTGLKHSKCGSCIEYLNEELKKSRGWLMRIKSYFFLIKHCNLGYLEN